MRVDLNPLRHRVILSKGARDGVFKGQPVLDATGVFGQITRAGAFTSEAILISDFEGAVPVQVNRNGLRTIAIGTGDLTRLSLPFLPLSADIRKGDLLVTSGLGGVYPQGYPVATVIEVNKERAQTLAAIDATPAATLDRDREVLLVWVKQPPIDVDKEVPTSPPPASSAASPKPGASAPKPAQGTPTQQTQPAQTAPAPGTPSTRPAQPRPRPEDRPASPREEPATQTEPPTEPPAGPAPRQDEPPRPDEPPRQDEPPQQDEPEPVLPPSPPSEEANPTKPPDPEPPPPEEDSQ
jgi:rod shape-determining protein MreC